MKPPVQISYQAIEELSSYTTAPVIEIIRTLLKCNGDIEVARIALTESGFGRIDVFDRKVAENLATTLVSEGLRFICETTDRHWRFRIPPNSVFRVRALGHLSRRRPREEPREPSAQLSRERRCASE